jgi:transcriptional regulator with XRE-family HTH domain
MTNSKYAKGVRPDGAKIKDLRFKAKKSQKSLIHGSTVELRTLQRAEKGEPVLPAILQQIASLLDVPYTDITLDDAASDQGNTYRLYNVKKLGGRKLYSALHNWGIEYNYSFAIDPDFELATLIADAIRYFQSFPIQSFDDYVIDPAQKILSIGAINDQLSKLESHCVWVYLGKWKEWNVKKEEDIRFGPDLTGGGTVSPSNLEVTEHVSIRFSGENVEYLVDTFFEFYSYERAVQHAIRDNLERGIHPDWLVHSSYLPRQASFIDVYRDAYEAAQQSKRRLAITDARAR